MPKPSITIPQSAVTSLTEFLAAIGVSVSPSNQDDVPDLHFRSARLAAAHSPHIYGTEDSVRWKLRHRRTNGLMDCGAVIEKWNHPGQKRPSLIIVHRRWVDWARKNPKN